MTVPSVGIGELARSAGVSVQHCRDLESAGVLPLVERTPGGHRRYGRVHVLAVRAYETLAAGQGFGPARRILALVNEGLIDEALELLDERHHTIHRQRDETRTALRMLIGAGIDDGQAIADSGLSIGAAADLIGRSISTLRHWENEGLVLPRRDGGNGYRRYDRPDLSQLHIVRMLRDAGYTIEQVGQVVTLLQQGRPERALELARHRLRELADASRAALAGDAALWDYLEVVAKVDVRPVGPHILYG